MDSVLSILQYQTIYFLDQQCFIIKNMYKQTWVSNDGITRNQFHILIFISNFTWWKARQQHYWSRLEVHSDHLVKTKKRIRISLQESLRWERIVRWSWDRRTYVAECLKIGGRTLLIVLPLIMLPVWFSKKVSQRYTRFS